jgi:hypothetical protein
MSKELIYTGIKHLYIGDEDEVPLADNLSLVKPTPFLLSGRIRDAMNKSEYEEAENASHYLVYSYENCPVVQSGHEAKKSDEIFYGGLMAFQIIKPVSTLGFIYRGTDYGGDSIHAAIEERRPMQAPEWASFKPFDRTFLNESIALIPRVQAALEGTSVPLINAITTLQLGMEIWSFHPYLAGLLWVMGMEAIFDSHNRIDFSNNLCNLLGSSTLVFPDWTELIRYPTRTVQDVAFDLYVLRNKLAHGADLMSAANDKTNPVDLLKTVRIHEYSQDRPYSTLLSEAACYLLCRVIQKTI